MGIAFGASRAGRGRRGRPAAAPIGEINITPLVDVMLVLLIVFMVAAPLMTMGVPMDLPKTAASPMPVEKKPITVTVTNAGDISIDGDPVTPDMLVATVNALAVEGTDERLYVRGDATVAYGLIMEVIGALSAAGYAQIGLIADSGQAD
jgi:biopolymer transport protein TolR